MKRIPPKTKWFFDQFIMAADGQMPNISNDWQPFYDFIQAAHKFRAKLFYGDVEEHLQSAGFAHEHAEHLALVYHHGRALLKRNSALIYIMLKTSWDKRYGE